MLGLFAQENLRDLIAANIWVAVPALVFTWLTISKIAENIRKSSQTKAREESRREIAAYVAEGSMTPEDAERLIAAGGKAESRKGGCC
jgi:hypothetical protein